MGPKLLRDFMGNPLIKEMAKIATNLTFNSGDCGRKGHGETHSCPGAAGRVGAVARTVTELLLKQGKGARVMARNQDERAEA